MKALTWHGKHDVRIDNVDDPEIVNPRDAIIKVTATAICGSDLHLYDGYIPTMQSGDILGHEFMGEVVETGSGSTLKKGQKVGDLKVALDGKTLVEEPLVALADGPEGGFFKRLSDGAWMWFKGDAGPATSTAIESAEQKPGEPKQGTP